MERARFKIGLFGFRRKQVLTYVNQTCQAYEAKLQEEAEHHAQAFAAMQTELEEKLRTHREGLIIQLEENSRLDQELALTTASLEEKQGLLNEAQAQLQQLTQTVEEKTAKALVLTGQLAAANQQQEQLAKDTAKLQRDSAAKDHIIAQQALELSRLQEQVSYLGETFDSLQVDADQSQAMMDCMNKLHERNRLLSTKVAQLEAQLQDASSEQQVKQFEQATAQKQELLKNTENLFNAVRKEIQEALQSIASKIEDETNVSFEEPENFFVDMAEL